MDSIRPTDKLEKPLSLNLKPGKQATQPPGLLTISAELRNLIYEYVLIKSKRISLRNHRSHQQPDLLRTCRQIRTEAIGIYYKDNKFAFAVHHYDGMEAMDAFRLVQKYGGSIKKNFIIELCSSCPTVNISNLQAWLEAYHEDPQVPSLRQDKRAEELDQQTLARRTFGVVKAMRSRPWEDVEDVLESFWRAIDMFQDMDEDDEDFTEEEDYDEYETEDDVSEQDESETGTSGDKAREDKLAKVDEPADVDEPVVGT